MKEQTTSRCSEKTWEYSYHNPKFRILSQKHDISIPLVLKQTTGRMWWHFSSNCKLWADHSPWASYQPKSRGHTKSHELLSLQLIKNTAYAGKIEHTPPLKESCMEGSTHPTPYNTTTDQEISPAPPSSRDPTYSHLKHRRSKKMKFIGGHNPAWWYKSKLCTIFWLVLFKHFWVHAIFSDQQHGTGFYLIQ